MSFLKTVSFGLIAGAGIVAAKKALHHISECSQEDGDHYGAPSYNPIRSQKMVRTPSQAEILGNQNPYSEHKHEDGLFPFMDSNPLSDDSKS